jgi:hypothetical protein
MVDKLISLTGLDLPIQDQAPPVASCIHDLDLLVLGLLGKQDGLDSMHMPFIRA